MSLPPAIERRRYALILGDILGPVRVHDQLPAGDLWGDDEPFVASFVPGYGDDLDDDGNEEWGQEYDDEPEPAGPYDAVAPPRRRGPSPLLVPIWQLVGL